MRTFCCVAKLGSGERKNTAAFNYTPSSSVAYNFLNGSIGETGDSAITASSDHVKKVDFYAQTVHEPNKPESCSVSFSFFNLEI